MGVATAWEGVLHGNGFEPSWRRRRDVWWPCRPVEQWVVELCQAQGVERVDPEVWWCPPLYRACMRCGQHLALYRVCMRCGGAPPAPCDPVHHATPHPCTMPP